MSGSVTDFFVKEKGSVFIEMALVVPIWIFMILAGAELFCAIRASHDLNAVLRVGIQAAEFGPAFSNGVASLPQSAAVACSVAPAQYNTCTQDLWATRSGALYFNCAHIVTQLKMCRAFQQINNSSLVGTNYTTSFNADGTVNVLVSSGYTPLLADIFGIGALNMNSSGIAQSYFDTN